MSTSFLSLFQAARRAAWATAGTVLQSGSGIGGWWFIYRNYERTVQKVRGVNGYRDVILIEGL
jgi:hypothetical protein